MSLKSRIKSLIRRLLGSSLDAGSVAEAQVDATEQKQDRAEDWLWDGYSWIPDWKEILGNDWGEWQTIAAAPKTGPKVLISTVTGGNSALTPLETLFAIALTLRGADVHFLLCDKSLPACQNCYGSDEEAQLAFIENGPSLCDWCYETGSRSIGQLGLPVHTFSALLKEDDWNRADKIAESADICDILSWKVGGVDVGEIVESAALRFFGRSDFEGEEHLLPILRRYFRSSLLSTWALNRLFDEENFEHVFSNQGLYVPQANVIMVSKERSCHVSSWDLAYRQLCINVSHDDTFIRTSLDEPLEHWENMLWNDATRAEVTEYMTGRWTGKFDWLPIVTGKFEGEPDSIGAELGLDLTKPTVGLLTNVIWDGST